MTVNQQLWRAAGVDLVPVGSQPPGLPPTTQCFTDVAWLTSDRLAVVTADGSVGVVGPTEVCQYCNADYVTQAVCN
jgi:hypothetical protein